MKITIRTPKQQELFFFAAYALFLISGILSTSFYYKYFIGSPYRAIKYTCLALLLFHELLNSKHKNNLKTLLIGVVFAALVLATRSQSSVSTVAFILIFVFCARKIDFEEIAHFSVIVTILLLIFVIGSAYLGIIQNYVYTSNTRIRYYLGFRYSLFAPVFLFNATGIILYLNRNRLKWITCILLLLANYWMFSKTNSRLSFGLSVVWIVVFMIYKLRPQFIERRRLINTLLVFSFLFCFCISIYFTVTYNSSVEWQKQLNTFLGSRLSLGKTSMLESGVSLFGQKLEMVGNGLDAYGKKNTNPYSYVDSFYVQILQRYGIVFTAVWLAVLTGAMAYFRKIKNYMMLICLAMVALHCVIDDLSLNLYYNTFWFAGTFIMRSARKEIQPENNS